MKVKSNLDLNQVMRSHLTTQHIARMSHEALVKVFPGIALLKIRIHARERRRHRDTSNPSLDTDIGHKYHSNSVAGPHKESPASRSPGRGSTATKRSGFIPLLQRLTTSGVHPLMGKRIEHVQPEIDLVLGRRAAQDGLIGLHDEGRGIAAGVGEELVGVDEPGSHVGTVCTLLED